MTLYHLSFDPKLPKILKPKQPNGSEHHDVKHITYEDLPPRVSFAPSIEQCWYAIYPNISKYFETHQYPYMDMYVYAHTDPRPIARIPDHVVKAKVHDAHITEEVCFLDSVSIILLGKIRIWNEWGKAKEINYIPFQDSKNPSRFLAPEMCYMVLDIYTKNSMLKSTGIQFYHYSNIKVPILQTLRKAKQVSDDTIRKAEYTAKLYGDIRPYVDHISLFLDPLQLETLPSIFGGVHPFYRTGATLTEYLITIKYNIGDSYALQETPIINDMTDRWSWSDITSEKRIGYLRRINKAMIEMGLQGDNFQRLSEVILPYIGKTAYYFKAARNKPNAADTLNQYAADVPHVMYYPADGELIPTRIRLVTLGTSTIVKSKRSIVQNIFKR